jgi:hypothetical protein
MANFVKDMLLIEGSEAGKLYKELSSIAGLFMGPMFLGSLCLQFLGGFDFTRVVKKLLIVSIVMTSFYTLHVGSISLSMEVANKTFKKISPRNVFRKKWYRATLTKRKKVESGSTWGFLKEFVTPSLNDLIASTFFVSSSVFMSLLKYIYTSIYHLTYIFAGFSALLYFWGITEGALWGMIKSTLWCILLPFVFISILSLIGNSLDMRANSGVNLFSEIETIIWLFCISLMLLMCPLITWKLVSNEGIGGSAPQMGALSVMAGTKILNHATRLPSIYRQGRSKIARAKESVGRFTSGKSQSSRINDLSRKSSCEKGPQSVKPNGERSYVSSSHSSEAGYNSQIEGRAMKPYNSSRSNSTRDINSNKEVQKVKRSSHQTFTPKSGNQRVERGKRMERSYQGLKSDRTNVQIKNKKNGGLK